MENDIFEKMPVPKAYFKLALPVVLGMVVSLIYNMVDTWFIARTQDTSLVAGVSLCAPLFTLMVAMGDMFGLGGSAVLSRLFGQKDEAAVKKISAFCFYGSILFSFVFTAFMLLLKTPILHLLGATDSTITFASDYYFWLVLGSPAIILTFVPSNLLRTEGLASLSMIGTIVGAVVNIVLDPILIFGLNMGAGGAALATVISNLIADIFFILFVLKKSKKLSISIKDFRLPFPQLGSIFMIGFPASITNIMQSFAITLTNRYLMSYGTDKVAALGISLKINMIIMLIMVGFAFGAQPLLGYNFGSGNHKRLKEILKFDLAVELIFSIVCAISFFAAAPLIVNAFMQDSAVIEAGTLILRCLMITSPLMGVILVFSTLFQSAGKAFPAFVLAIGRQGIFLALCMVILASLFGYMGVICAQAAADFVTFIITIGFVWKLQLV